jgi:DNA-binding transcriptional regulator YiaG
VPNIGSVLREEIVRLSRKEGRGQLSATKKATAQHRRDIAALKRQVAALERQVKLVSRRALQNQPAGVASGEPARFRFVAKGLRSHRARLGLSASSFGKLIGASANSVYAWESGNTVPRREQVAKIAAARSLSKREASKRLMAGGATNRKGS